MCSFLYVRSPADLASPLEGSAAYTHEEEVLKRELPESPEVRVNLLLLLLQLYHANAMAHHVSPQHSSTFDNVA